MEEEKEYVSLYLPKSLAKKIKQLESGESHEDIVQSFLDESKRDIKNSLECLEDDVLEYKALMTKAKVAFREAKEEQLQASYELWEKFEEDLPSVEEKITKLINKLKPVERQLSQINDLLNGLSFYSIENAMELIGKINQMTSETKNIFKFLLENYK